MKYAIELLQEQLRLLQDDLKSMLLVDDEFKLTTKRVSDVIEALNKLMVKPSKPISELNKEDAIEIAKAATGNNFNIHSMNNKSYLLLANVGSVYIELSYNDILFCKAYSLNNKIEVVNMKHNQAKVIDKARELGYDV